MHRLSFPFLVLVWRLIFLTAVIFIVAISTKPVAEPMTTDEITYNSANSASMTIPLIISMDAAQAIAIAVSDGTNKPHLLATDEQTEMNDSNTTSEPDIICEPSNLNPPIYPDDFKHLQGKVEIFGPTYGFVGEPITI